MPSAAAPLLPLLSFPTRRSSDLHSVFYLSGAALWLRNPRVALAVPYLGAPRLRSGPDAHCHAPCRRAQKIWTLRSAPHRLAADAPRSEEHTSELQSRFELVCPLLRPPSSLCCLSLHDALPICTQYFIFPVLLFGFGILVSLWPFHTWAPLGYGAAPTPTAMLHAGVLKKFGLYGLLRIALPLMPQDRKSTRLNSSHVSNSYALCCGPPPPSAVFPYTTLFRSALSILSFRCCSLASESSCRSGRSIPGRPSVTERPRRPLPCSMPACSKNLDSTVCSASPCR